MNINELIDYLNELPSSGFALHCYDEDDDLNVDGDFDTAASPFTRNDGGRAASGRKGIAGDCGVRAMAIALGRDYDECYKELAQANKDAGKAKSMRRGIMKSDFEKVLARYGWVWCPAPKFDGRKARCSDMPKGAVIARQARHFVAVINGQPHDTWDCSEKMVYGYWRKA